VYSRLAALESESKACAHARAARLPDIPHFCGDPDLPGEESHESGRLSTGAVRGSRRATVEGVYRREEEKIRDWNSSLPPS